MTEAIQRPAQPRVIDLDPASANERETVGHGEQAFELRGGQRLAIERDLHAKIEQRVLAQTCRDVLADGGGDVRTGGAVPLPGRGHPHHHARAFQLRDVGEKPKRLRGRPPQRMEDLAGIDHAFQPRAALRGALHGNEQRQQALPVRDTGELVQRLSEWQVLGFAVCGQASGVGGEEGERRRVVLTVLGQVEVDAANEVPGRAAVPEEVLHRGS